MGWLERLRRVLWHDPAPAPETEHEGHAQRLGRFAYEGGQPLSACPYEGRAGELWRRSWREAHADDIRI